MSCGRFFKETGWENLNAYTSKDATTFHALMPSSKLELWAYLISSMLYKGVPREFYSEKKVVMEERRSSIDDSPNGKAYEKFVETFFKGTPYEWTTIGRKLDVERFSVNDVTNFYKTEYTPDKMVGAIVGDIDISRTKSIMRKYFGRIPRGKTTKSNPKKCANEPGGREGECKVSGKTVIEIGFHKPTVPAEDDYVFDVIYCLLCEGKTSRLFKRLVIEDEIATSVMCATSTPGREIG